MTKKNINRFKKINIHVQNNIINLKYKNNLLDLSNQIKSFIYGITLFNYLI